MLKRMTPYKTLKVCDNPHIEDIDLFYTNMRGDSCSRCQLNHCSGCRVPENYEIELKKYDNFKVVTSTRFDELRQIKSVSYKEYLETRPTLQTCLDIFSTPEKLEENTVSCQKCNQQTGASKVRDRKKIFHNFKNFFPVP